MFLLSIAQGVDHGVHLAELLELRSSPAAGVFAELTRRCPLACAHCSTNSSSTAPEKIAPEKSAALFTRFAATFAGVSRPRVLLMSGGEPLLRPSLVRHLARHARAAGTASYVLTGAFFAGRPRIPAPIAEALADLDHLAVSMDAFHQAEVPAGDVFRLLSATLDRGADCSVQITARGPDDPFPADTVAALRTRFDDRVPVLVVPMVAAGRAAAWFRAARAQDTPDLPCAMAAWPVVAQDGAISACCNQRVIDGDGPPHLRLGHAAWDSWSTVARRCRNAPVLRGLRTHGPRRLAGLLDSPVTGYCATCQALPASGRAQRRVAEMMATPASRAAEAMVPLLAHRAGARGFAARYGVAAYAGLPELGRDGGAADVTTDPR
jgi:hypothetical protein